MVFLLLSIFPHFFIVLCLKCSQKSPFNQNRPHKFALCSPMLSNQASFRSTCLTKTWWIVFTFSWHLAIVSDFPSFILDSLLMCHFNCETCFCQIFWQFGTEFLYLANLSFRFICYGIDLIFCLYLLILKLKQK